MLTIAVHVVRLLTIVLIAASYPVTAFSKNQCLQCHAGKQSHLNVKHQFARQMCASCHLGDESAIQEAVAHRGMVISPGNLDNADKTCAACHAQHVIAVGNSVMHTGKSVVSTTREVLEPTSAHEPDASFQRLGNGLADSMLRKLCASCHLGHRRRPAKPEPVTDRGGGCLACHLNTLPENGHPMLTIQVEDGRCFGCHSRSGRISLSYAGLAEVDKSYPTHDKKGLARMSDGRLVSRQHADLHHRAGMACIDCHTGAGLMGLNEAANQPGVDIRCRDCHDNQNPRLNVVQWPSRYGYMLDEISYKAAKEQVFLQTAAGTPLVHIEVTPKGLWLHPKLGGQPLRIPQIKNSHQSLLTNHARLTCDSCHASWVPTCLGCHMNYEEAGQQWDHSLQKVTGGVWHEKRWDIGIGRPSLGMKDAETIDTFIPGMIMTLDHPQLEETLFIRRFARISPHTTGPSRGCEGCHQSPVMLGLGKGKLSSDGDELQFAPDMGLLADGLPADAWAKLADKEHKQDTDYPRPFNAQDINRLYRAHRDQQPDANGQDSSR